METGDGVHNAAEWLASSLLTATALQLEQLAHALPGDISSFVRNVLGKPVKYDLNMARVVELALDRLPHQVRTNFIDLCRLVIQKADVNFVVVEYESEHGLSIVMDALSQAGIRPGEHYDELDGALRFPQSLFDRYQQVIMCEVFPDYEEEVRICRPAEEGPPTTDGTEERSLSDDGSPHTRDTSGS